MYKLGFIGAGKMGGACLVAFLKSGAVKKDDLLVCDASEEILAKYRQEKIAVTDSPADVAISCKAIFVAIKPQDFDACLMRINHCLDKTKLLISIAAGKSIETIRALTSDGVRIIRVMPNLPVLVGAGMVAYACDNSVRETDVKLAKKLLSSCGEAVQLSEEHLDAVTALSGSGPAFFTYFLREMAQAGAKAGLPEDVAKTLALQTMYGTALYLKETKADAQDFIKAVCSPKGTTEAGMKVLEKSSIPATAEATIKAAKNRSFELCNNK